MKVGRQPARSSGDSPDKGSSFFVDSTHYAKLDDKGRAGPWRVSSVLIFMVVLAAAFGIAALLGTIYVEGR
jgi:hypothetical protein